MAKRVLDVGQCNADHSRITFVLRKNFDVEITRAHSLAEAARLSRKTSYDLILINRLLDADGSEGIEVLRLLKSDESTAKTPVIVISNFEDARNQAVAAGAEPGFGKSSLESPATLELLGEWLGE